MGNILDVSIDHNLIYGERNAYRYNNKGNDPSNVSMNAKTFYLMERSYPFKKPIITYDEYDCFLFDDIKIIINENIDFGNIVFS
jgi:hypothetical protein